MTAAFAVEHDARALVAFRALARGTWGLTARQAECLYWLCAGAARRDLPARLGLTGDTIANHLTAVHRALGTPCAAAAAARAWRVYLVARYCGGGWLMAEVDGQIRGGRTVATKAQARAYLLAGPGRRVSDAEVGEIVDALWEFGAQLGVRADLATAQVAHETNRLAFTGDVQPEQHNVAGIGTTGGGVKGHAFPDWRTGVEVYYAHLLAWTGDTVLGKQSPRYDLVRAAIAQKGVATTWRSLGSRWAVPGEQYGDGIEKHYRAMLALPGEDRTMVEKPPVISKPTSKHGYDEPHRPGGIVWHITAGVDSLDWLTNAATNPSSSSNYLIAKDGTIYELVTPDKSAWANGAVNRPNTANPFVARVLRENVNFNTRTISIEVEARRGEVYTRAQQDAVVRLSAWLCERFHITPDANHLITHSEIDSVNRPHCPGQPPAVLAELRARTAALVAGGVRPAPIPVDPGFPGALQPDGRTVLNGVDFGGKAVSVVEVAAVVRNEEGQHYKSVWRGHQLEPWVEV